MTRKINEKSQKYEVELSDDDLEQVSGGFNPQPDPPARYAFKYNQQLSSGPLVIVAQPVVQKVKQ